MIKLVLKFSLIFVLMFVACDFFIYFIADGMYKDLMSLGCDSITSICLTIVIIILCASGTIGIIQVSNDKKD